MLFTKAALIALLLVSLAAAQVSTTIESKAEKASAKLPVPLPVIIGGVVVVILLFFVCCCCRQIACCAAATTACCCLAPSAEALC